MCLWCTSQVVSKEHSAEARGEWAREGGGSNQYWSAIRPVLVSDRTSTGHTAEQYWSLMPTSTGRCSDQYYFIFPPRWTGAVGVAICLCDSALSSGAKAS